MALRITWLIAVLIGVWSAAEAADYTLPDGVSVLPVAFVPSDEQPPDINQQQLFLRQIQWTRRRFGEMLGGDTFSLARQEEVAAVRGARPLDFYRKQPERGAPDIVAELLAHFRFSRFNCPYVFCILLMNPRDSFPEGGGRTINGGLNTGGGMMYIASSEMQRNEHFQCTLQHELGHGFGLPHVDVYGYDMQSSPSIMSYNPAHHNQGFQPSPTPGGLIPEDRRGLALNRRVFPRTAFDPRRDVPAGYSLSNRIVPLGPMQLPGIADFYPQVTTTAGEDVGSKVANVVSAEIQPSVGPGITYNPATMWHSKPLPDGKAVLDISFPMRVRLSAIAVHSQHSGIDHAATALRLTVVDGTDRRTVVEQADLGVNQIVKFPPVAATNWSLELSAGKSRTLVIRGLRFFDGDEEVCPHQVPYQDKPSVIDGQNAAPLVGQASAPAAPRRLTAPDPTAQLKARKTVKETFKSDYSKAKKAEAKTDLARALLKQAAQSDDVASVVYVLHTEAIDLAVLAGRWSLANEAIDSLATRFDVDALSMKERTIVKLKAANMSPAEAGQLLGQFLALADEAAAAEKYALAVKVMHSAAEEFRKPVFKALRDQALVEGRQFAMLKDVFEDAKTAREQLADNADNAAANLAWGRFVCFYQQDWGRGLPLLAKGNDKVWAPLAQRDLAPSPSANALLQAGDDWLKAGEKEKEPIKSGVRLRADRAYAAALAAVEPGFKLDLEQKLDPRLIRLFGATYLVANGDAAGAEIVGTEPLSPGETWTIEFWVSTMSSRGTLISKRHLPGDATVLAHLDDGVVNLSVAIGGGESGSGGGARINDGRWHHIALVKQAQGLKLFVDGQSASSATVATPLLSDSPWKFGCSLGRPACAARFGGTRISNVARYSGSFSPQFLHPRDRKTLYPL